jgi:uncharacterized protein DUF4232
MRPFWSIAGRVLLVAVVVFAVRIYSDRGAAQPTLGTASVIPWTPTSPEPAPSPSPTPTPAADAPPCDVSNIRAAYWNSGAATGHTMTAFSFVNAGAERCFVLGRPTVELVNTKGRRLPRSSGEPSFYPDDGPIPVVLEPGVAPPHENEGLPKGAAVIGIELFDCNADYQIGRVLVTFAGGTIEPAIRAGAIGTSGQAVCDEPERAAAPPNTAVSNFAPAPEPEPPREASPYSMLQVSIEAPTSVEGGDRLRYFVTLRNTGAHPFVFPDECPTYREGLKGITGELYSLNCAGVVIGADEVVTFEMFLAIPRTSDTEDTALLWWLDPYRFGPGNNLMVEVRA